MKKLFALLVHIYTALGVIIAFLMVVAAIKADLYSFLWLSFITLVIDSTDGTLARYFQVKKYMPEIDGALLDNIVDYITYVFAPAILFWTQNMVPQNTTGILILGFVMLASCYQFCRTDAKTDNKNYFFLGFPDYWNVVALYAIILSLSQNTVSAILIMCAVLVFIPIKFLYPSRTKQYKIPTMIATLMWLTLYIIILIQYPSVNYTIAIISLLYWVYYIIMSLSLTISLRK